MKRFFIIFCVLIGLFGLFSTALNQKEEFQILIKILKITVKSEKPDSIFFFGVADLIYSEYYYEIAPPPKESLLTIWKRTKKEIKKLPEKNDSIIFAGLKRFCSLFKDGYTYFFTSEDINREREKHQYFGIGIQLIEFEDKIRIFRVFPNTPAEKVGLKIGDVILEINGRPVSEFKSLKEIGKAFKQDPEKVNLKIWRKKWKKAKNFTIKKSEIIIKPVNFKKIKRSIAYIELKEFSSEAVKEFKNVVTKIDKRKTKVLILDLRDNLGGDLVSVEEILSYFTSGLCYKLKNKKGYQDFYCSGFLRRPLNELKTVILINSMTASASELLIGALSDYYLATLIGERTYGKGCYQRIISLPYSTVIRVTVGYWLTPKGRCVEKKGISPDIEVKFDLNLWLEKNIDNQLQKALEFIKDSLLVK
jgi:carboxyl-terminal processing protease